MTAQDKATARPWAAAEERAAAIHARNVAISAGRQASRAAVLAERDALQAENAALRAALRSMVERFDSGCADENDDDAVLFTAARAALAGKVAP